MLSIKVFEFNGFVVNTYVLSSINNECVVIDPGFYNNKEKKVFDTYITENNLKIVKVLNTHCHIDHILGITHIEETYGVGAYVHPAAAEFLRASVGYASVFGFEVEKPIKPAGFFNEGDIITFGDEQLEILYTPGHADGSVCFVNHAHKIVFTGDVLFRESIGRTDFPTGDYDLLIQKIREKLFTLDDDYVIYPGHGPKSTIGYEKANNPYLI